MVTETTPKSSLSLLQFSINVQHLIYAIVVILVNLLLIYNSITSPCGLTSVLLVGMVYLRDSVYVLVRFIHTLRVGVYKGGSSALNRCNVLCVLPTYKEEEVDVATTLDSLIRQKDGNGEVRKCMIMVCDGHFNYSHLFSSMVLTDSVQYQTFKRKRTTFNVYRAIYKANDVLVLVKAENAGKKDSLILINKIMLHDDFKQLRDDVLRIFNVSHFDYIFNTDADTYVEDTTLYRASRILTTNQDVSAVAGMVMVSQNFSFWSLYQGFEYYYDQVICRLTESCWRKPFILPGCIDMVNITDESVVEASREFERLPSRNNIFEMNDRLQGTDRRWASCLLNHSPQTNLLFSDKLICYTKPPQTFRHFISQRNRWLSNAISGHISLLSGEHSPWHVRACAMFELVHVHTCVSRLLCCVLLMMFIAQLNHNVLVSIRTLALIPFLFSIAHACTRGSYTSFLLVGCFVSTCAAPFLNACVFVNCMMNFTNVSWGMSHGNLEKKK